MLSENSEIICLLKLYVTHCAILYQLYKLKKREKHPWRSLTFSKVSN